MTKKTTKTTSNETATTQPQVPSYVTPQITDYYGKVGNFMSGNPSDWYAPINSIQQGAFSGVNNLGLNQDDYQNAIQMAHNADLAARQVRDPTLTTARNPVAKKTADVAGIGPRSVSQAALGTLGPAAMAEAANAGNASTVALRGYDPRSVQTQGYDASLMGRIDPRQYLDTSVERVNPASVLENFDAYANPATEGLVDATLANVDDYNARQRAAQSADMARTGAFGGSRAGIAEAQLLSDQGRQRGLTEAELRNQAFLNAAGLSQYDATNRQNAGMFNAGAQNERDLAFGQMGYQGELSRNLANQDALNRSREFGANAYNQGQFYNADAANQAAQFGANAYNTGALSNQDAANQFALQNAGFQQQANLANAGAQNQFGLERFGAENALNLANMGAQNDAYGQQYDVSAQNAQQDAAARNAMLSQIYGTQADTNRFNAGQANDMSQFTSNLGLQRAQQQLAAAGMLGDLAGNMGESTRADIGLQADLGQQLYNLQQQRSPLGQLMTSGALLDPEILRIITGQTINSQGTSTSKQSGGLLGSLLAAGSQLGSAAIMASERRVKRDIALLDREADGLGVYSFNYIWDEPGESRRYGVMADEVEQLRPWALGPVMNGIQTVDYGAL